MAKKSFQARARQSGQGKKRKRSQPRRPYLQKEATAASAPRRPAQTSAARSLTSSTPPTIRAEVSRASQSQSYVGSDLKRIAIFSVLIFAILIVLGIFLRSAL